MSPPRTRRQLTKLLARMTRAEKIAQVQSAMGSQCGLPPGYSVVKHGIPPELAKRIADGLGHLHNICEGLPPRELAESINRLQEYAVSHSRLGIPLLIHGESLHGWYTIFPQAIALGSTWNPALIRRIYETIALEMRSCGYHVTYSPVLDLATDPRWGRFQECFGEDPLLVARLGAAAILGYQGDPADRLDANHVVAVAKHFAGYGQSDGGRNFAPVNIGPRRLHEEILEPFRVAVTEAGVLGIMPAHTEIDGTPCHANSYLLLKVLRRRWRFRGMVVSDADDIRRLFELHGVAADEIEAAALGLRHRIAVDILGCTSYRLLNQVLDRYPELEANLDRIVLDVLDIKRRLGLFECPFVDSDRAEKVCHAPEHVALARTAATEAAILLKNAGGLLPLSPNRIRRLAVIGPNANHIQCGTYGPSRGISIYQGLLDYAEGRFEVIYARGCRITHNESEVFLLEGRAEAAWLEEADPRLVSDEENAPLIAEAVQVAARADVVVLVLGGNNYTGREAFYVQPHKGDLADLRLPGSQETLLRAIHGTGRPIVLILNHGNAAVLDPLLPMTDAVLEIWYAGEQTGPAVADILFGRATPGGRLPVTFPRATGSVPCVGRQKPSGTLKTPLFLEPGPTFPLGYGLTYTCFMITRVQLDSAVLRPGGRLSLSVQVANVGDYDGDAVVQVYLRDHCASVTRPLRQLIDFRRVRIVAGTTVDVLFHLDESHIRFIRADGVFGPEPGDFSLFIGFDSQAQERVDFRYVVD